MNILIFYFIFFFFFFFSQQATGIYFFFFFQAEDGIRDRNVTGDQTCALPIYPFRASARCPVCPSTSPRARCTPCSARTARSEEHTSELQSRFDLVCRLLL